MRTQSITLATQDIQSPHNLVSNNLLQIKSHNKDYDIAFMIQPMRSLTVSRVKINISGVANMLLAVNADNHCEIAQTSTIDIIHSERVIVTLKFLAVLQNMQPKLNNISITQYCYDDFKHENQNLLLIPDKLANLNSDFNREIYDYQLWLLLNEDEPADRIILNSVPTASDDSDIEDDSDIMQLHRDLIQINNKRKSFGQLNKIWVQNSDNVLFLKNLHTYLTEQLSILEEFMDNIERTQEDAKNCQIDNIEELCQQKMNKFYAILRHLKLIEK